MPWRDFDIPKDAEDLVAKRTRFLVDDSLGVEAARVIREFDWNVTFAGDRGLGGKPESSVMALAWREDRISADARSLQAIRTTEPQ